MNPDEASVNSIHDRAGLERVEDGQGEARLERSKHMER